MASPGPDLFMPARGHPEFGLRAGLFDKEPSAAAIERRGSDGRGETFTPCPPLAVFDGPNILKARGALVKDECGISFHTPDDVICIRSRPNALPYGHTAALVKWTRMNRSTPRRRSTRCLSRRGPPPLAAGTSTKTSLASSLWTGVILSTTPRATSTCLPTIYLLFDAGGRTLNRIATPNQPRVASSSTPSTIRPTSLSKARSPAADASSSPSPTTCLQDQRPRPR